MLGLGFRVWVRVTCAVSDPTTVVFSLVTHEQRAKRRMGQQIYDLSLGITRTNIFRISKCRNLRNLALFLGPPSGRTHYALGFRHSLLDRN